MILSMKNATFLFLIVLITLLFVSCGSTRIPCISGLKFAGYQFPDKSCKVWVKYIHIIEKNDTAQTLRLDSVIIADTLVLRQKDSTIKGDFLTVRQRKHRMLIDLKENKHDVRMMEFYFSENGRVRLVLFAKQQGRRAQNEL